MKKIKKIIKAIQNRNSLQFVIFRRLNGKSSFECFYMTNDNRYVEDLQEAQIFYSFRTALHDARLEKSFPILEPHRLGTKYHLSIWRIIYQILIDG